MSALLEKYLPENAVRPIYALLKAYNVKFIVKNARVTRHGDYRKLPTGQHQITINAGENKYRFMLTTIHELAHLIAHEKYGRYIKPHGLEWKNTFIHLMQPFLNSQIFPEALLPYLKSHFLNPSASSDTDALLSMALKKYDAPNDLKYIDELPLGTVFRTQNGKIFIKGKKRVKLFECTEMHTQLIYLFKPNIQVELV